MSVEDEKVLLESGETASSLEEDAAPKVKVSFKTFAVGWIALSMVPPLVCYEPFSHEVTASVSSNVGKFTSFAGTKIKTIVEWVPPDAVLPPNPECFHEPDASDYSGTVSVTVSNIPCQKWTLPLMNDGRATATHDAPHVHRTAGLIDVGYDHNYCRNPWAAEETDDSGAWCYTTDEAVVWEYCDVGSPSAAPCPHTPTPTSGAWAQCEDTCEYAGDGQCDDGGPRALGS
eukprot:scaffold24946_cov36-Phaeocystis_antarctica.AAC.1